MPKVYQTYNKKTNSWVKFKEMNSGKSKIVNVKEKKPKQKFKGVPVKK